VLAAIGTVESGNGTSNLPECTRVRMRPAPRVRCSSSRPRLPPTTSRSLGRGRSPQCYDATDAVYAAARLLCADGGSGGANISAAIFAYNHDATYVAKVLSLAQSFGQVAPSSDIATSVGATAAGATAAGATAAGATAVAWAMAQVGTPYIWGGESPGVGFDCSGLTQASYRVAGVALPRVAQDQFDASPKLPAGTELEPGDLVFFGTGPQGVSHVGLYLGVQGGRTYMVDAPHTGADVRSSLPATPGAKWAATSSWVPPGQLVNSVTARRDEPVVRTLKRRRGVYTGGRRGVPKNR